MKMLLISALIAALFTNASAATPPSTSTVIVGEAATYTLTVMFSNVTKRAGKLHIGIANDEASFTGTSYRKVIIDVPATGEVSAKFEGLPAGKCAVRVFQDLNENDKIDFAGQMPTEPVGFSNMPMLMGPPDFSQCAFDLTQDQNVSIRLLSL